MFGKVSRANGDLYVVNIEDDLSEVPKNRLNQQQMDKYNQSQEPIRRQVSRG